MQARERGRGGVGVLGLDDQISAIGSDGGLALAPAAAVLLGLRHATDPDHLTAVSVLVMSDRERGARRASVLGLAWGVGHGLTVFTLGLPVVLLGAYLPESVRQVAELAIGATIVALAIRLLIRWRRGYLHAHVHSHGPIRHSHPHAHEGETAHRQTAHEHSDHGQGPHPHSSHNHSERELLASSPLTAFGIGLAHGVGGSAAAGIFVIAAVSDSALASLALLLFAAATAASMALCSLGFGRMLSREPLARGMATATPALGIISLLFGCWYALGALESVPYPF